MHLRRQSHAMVAAIEGGADRLIAACAWFSESL